MAEYAPVIYQVPQPYDANPWVHETMRRAAIMADGDPPSVWAAQALQDYQGHEEPLPCPCGGHLWYRAATLGLKCPDCGALGKGTGQIIGYSTTRQGA